MLKGDTAQVSALAVAIRAERGVRFGELNLIAVAPNGDHGPAAGHKHGRHELPTPELGWVAKGPVLGPMPRPAGGKAVIAGAPAKVFLLSPSVRSACGAGR